MSANGRLARSIHRPQIQAPRDRPGPVRGKVEIGPSLFENEVTVFAPGGRISSVKVIANGLGAKNLDSAPELLIQ